MLLLSGPLGSDNKSEIAKGFVWLITKPKWLINLIRNVNVLISQKQYLV